MFHQDCSSLNYPIPDSSSLNYPIHCSIRFQLSARFSWQLTGDGRLEIFPHATITSIELATTLECEPICQDVLSRAKNTEIIADIFCFNYGFSIIETIFFISKDTADWIFIRDAWKYVLQIQKHSSQSTLMIICKVWPVSKCVVCGGRRLGWVCDRYLCNRISICASWRVKII